MKKSTYFSYFFLCFILIFFLSYGSGFSENKKPSVSFKLTGAVNFISPEDVNTATQGWSKLNSEVFLSSLNQEGEIESLNMGFDAGGEIIFQFSRHLGVGIGAGYIHAARNSKAEFSNGILKIMRSKPIISAVPVKLGLYYFLPVGDRLNTYINAGPAFYFVNFDHKWNIDESLVRNQSTSSSGLGFHGALGLEYQLTSRLSLLIEGSGRYCKMSGFEGNSSGNEGASTFSMDGTLYYVEFSTFPDPVMYIKEEFPSSFKSARQAEIDLSGIAIRGGLKIRF